MQSKETRSPNTLAPSTKPRRAALVVGPAPDLAIQVADMLPDWKIERASSNAGALGMLEAAHFDLVVTGENTSGAADLELLRKIRRVRPHVRLLILTRESTPEDVIASMREGAFSYFSTPYSSASLADMIRLAAEGPCWDDGIEVISATPAWIQLLARCDKGTADRLLQFFHEIIDLPDPEREGVATAFREMLLNAIEHGGHFDPSQFVEISYLRARHAVMCRVKDPGEGFSFEEIKHAAISNPPDHPLQHQSYRDARGLRPGGFGVLMTSRLVDELIYGESGNEVLLIKYLDVAPTTTQH
ncbi:MAG TPA: ATP-binding protein [Candidatus Binatia bacterium]|nr:ATP-binding protein [Candidatus Binatia bacterium]